MKTIFVQIGVLFAVTALAVAIGYAPTSAHWGRAGLDAMWAAAIICLAAALLAAVTLGVVIIRWPSYAAQAAFGGTAIRLLVTGALGIAYQVLVDVPLKPFLIWLLVLYLLLMVVETTLSIVLVRRCLRIAPGGGE